MAILFDADSELVEHSVPAFGAGWVAAWLQFDSLTERQTVWSAMAVGLGVTQPGLDFRADLAGDVLQANRNKDGGAMQCFVQFANFRHARLGAWLFLAHMYNPTSPNTTDHKMLMGDMNQPPEEPSSYDTQSIGGGTVVTTATSFRYGNGQVTTREFRGGVAWMGMFNAYPSVRFVRDVWDLTRRGRFDEVTYLQSCVLNARPGMGKTFAPDLSKSQLQGTITGATQMADPFMQVRERIVMAGKATSFDATIVPYSQSMNPILRSRKVVSY